MQQMLKGEDKRNGKVRKMIPVGQVCIKTAGRDSGKKGVIVDLLDENFALIDGQVRRRKCNMKHLEPLKAKIKIDKNAPHETVVAELKKIGIEVTERKTKEKKEKPKKARKVKKKAASTAKTITPTKTNKNGSKKKTKTTK